MKKFFEKAKLNYKFKKAGEGHTLEGDSSSSSLQQGSSSQTPATRAMPSSDAQRAGQVCHLLLIQLFVENVLVRSCNTTWDNIYFVVH